MQAREWFLDKPGDNTYDIEVHVQRSFWHNGFGEVFFRCTKADPPYKCEGFWRGQELEFEWVPRQWLTLYLQEYDEGIVAGFSGVMRLDPSIRYTLAAAGNGEAPEASEAGQEEAEPEAENGDQASDEPAGDAGPQAQPVVEWRVRDVDERMRELIEQEGVSDVRRV